MQFSIERAPLLKALSHVQSVVEKRTTIPILANVLLTAEQGSLALCATDMDIEMIEYIPATVAQSGTTTVAAARLYEIVRKLPDDSSITFQLNDAATSLSFSCGNSNFKLGCLPREDFPAMTAPADTQSFRVPVSAFKQLIDRTKFAMSNEETRYYLNGIYMHAVDEDNQPMLRAAATDGHRLARFQMALPAGAASMPGIIVPRKTVGELRKLLDEAGDDVLVAVTDKMIRLTFDHITLTSKLVDGTFPDYERVIPQQNDKTLTLDPRQFSKSVDRVATVAAEKTRAVKLSIKGKTLVLSASNTDADSAQEEVQVEFDHAAPLDIGFNAKYLLDVTQLIDSDSCRMLLGDGNTPAIVQDNHDLSALYVLMPMRV
jgi:DNA polymerase III subunit beta